MPTRNLVSWTRTISSLLRTGSPELSLREFFLMCNSGLRPNQFGFSLALKASRITNQTAIGNLLHGCTIKSGFESNPFCSTAILDMYVKHGDMGSARMFFGGVESKCEALWNTMIDGCVRSYDADAGIKLFNQMLRSGTSPNSFTYTILIRLSADIADIELSRFLHGRSIRAGFDGYNFVGGALVDAYAKWGELGDACSMFWSVGERDHVLWSALLAGFCYNGESQKGIELYLQFISEGYRPDPFIYASVFKLCSGLGNPELGLQVHCCFTKSGFVVDSFVGSALIDMYASFRMVADAYRSFSDTRGKNEVFFSAMIHAFVSDSDYISALGLVSEMGRLGLQPDYSTLNFMLRAYANLDMLKEGRVLHARIVKTIGETDLVMGNTLLEMYANTKDVDQAAKVFEGMVVRNEFSWTSLISGYTESERNEEALEVFHVMLQSYNSVKPSQFTLVAVLQAVSKLRELHKGKQIHSYVVKNGFQSHAYIESALTGMYSKCNSVDDASQIFSNMKDKDLVSWSTMISAYAQHGDGVKALKLFSEHSDTTVDESILSSCLSACSSLAAMQTGRSFHVIGIKRGYESNSQVGGALVDMYCKCGSIEDAHKVFNVIKECNVVCYTTMVYGYGHHGLGQEALSLFNEMQEAGIEPDSVTFTGVLSACRHLGMVEKGWYYFESMSKDYGLERTMSHYACMVDLLGRSGQVNEAEKLIDMAPFSSKTLLWRSLLGACSKYGDVEVGNRIAKMLIRLHPDQPSHYVSLSNLYASASLWDESVQLKNKMETEGMRKEPGCSWIEVSN